MRLNSLLTSTSKLDVEVRVLGNILVFMKPFSAYPNHPE